MDEKWQEWQTRVLRPLLKHSPDSDPAPELEQLLASDPATIDLALLAADTDRTQEYVFESTKLPEIRGGSELLIKLNKGLRTIINEAGLPDEDCVLMDSGGGLLALVPASVCTEHDGRKGLAQQIEEYYPTETGQATITCVWRPVTPEEVIYGLGGKAISLDDVDALRTKLNAQDWQRVAHAYGVKNGGLVPVEAFRQTRGFGQMVQVVSNQLRQRKDRPPVVPVAEAMPFAMRCKICQIRPAESMYPYYGEMWPLCDICRRKARTQESQSTDAEKEHGWASEARSQQVKDFLKWLEEPDAGELRRVYWNEVNPTRAHFAQDLEDLGKACEPREGYVGFIYADGNRMGQILQSLRTLKDYRTFSKGLQTAIGTAVYQALAENLHPTLIERMSATGTPLGKGWIHPLEPLVVGGDDVMLIVPGHAALPVAIRICQIFERKMQEPQLAKVLASLPENLRHPTLSVGVVIAECHNPVRVLQQVSKELCKNAKRRNHDEENTNHIYTSALDILLIKSQSMLRQKVKQLRRQPPYSYPETEFKQETLRRYLTAGPYTLAESCRLLKLLKITRQVDFPNSQLQGVVTALQRGRRYGSVHYLYQQARLNARLGDARQNENILTRLTQIWPYDDLRDPIPWHRIPWEKEKEVYASIVPDLLELYPFVPKPAADDLWIEILKEADRDNSH
jgi:CRISPR-associated protein Cmr2